MKKLFLTLLTAMSAFCLYAYEPAINDINIHVSLSQDGTASIVEVWDVVVASGTEWYLVRQNLGDIEIKNLSVSDESGTQYTNTGSWNIDLSLEQKAFKCGLHSTGSGYEICWGVGSYGPHVFTVRYVMTNAVKSLNDYDMLHMQFISDELSSPPSHASLTLTAPEPLGEGNSRIWSFGYEGTINWQGDGSVKAESTEPFIRESSMILLLRFDKGIFEPSSIRDKDFSEVLDRAKEGSFYPDNEEDSWVYTLLGMLLSLGLLWLFIIQPIKKFFQALGLFKSKDRRRIKDIFGVRRLPKQVDWVRDVPFGGDPYRTYYVASHIKGYDNGSYTIVSAMLLRMILDGVIEMRTAAGGKNEFCFSNKASQYQADEAEGGLLRLIQNASGADGVLQEQEFKKWTRSHESSVRSFISTVKTRVVNNFRTAGMLGGRDNYYDLNLNETGRSEAMRALGFRQFLNDFTLVSERNSVEVALWGDYLVMASVFGLADKVAAEMKKMAPDLKVFDKLPVNQLSDLVIFTNTFGRLTSNAYRYSLAPSSGGYSGGGRSSGGFGGHSSFGGGGGFSGGGSGGGSR